MVEKHTAGKLAIFRWKIDYLQTLKYFFFGKRTLEAMVARTGRSSSQTARIADKQIFEH